MKSPSRRASIAEAVKRLGEPGVRTPPATGDDWALWIMREQCYVLQASACVRGVLLTRERGIVDA